MPAFSTSVKVLVTPLDTLNSDLIIGNDAAEITMSRYEDNDF